MQIRCYHCQKPFALGKDAIHEALDAMEIEKMGHYNASCPHCRRVNRVSRDEMRRAAPDWQPQVVKQETSE